MASFDTSSLPSLPETPNQPTVDFQFPKRSFGKTKPVMCSAKNHWFQMWPFLHYDEAQDAMYYHTCVKAFFLGKTKCSNNASAAFVSRDNLYRAASTAQFSYNRNPIPQRNS